jgi:hypothetical protein
MTKCDILPSEDIKVTTNWICCSGTPDRGTIFEGWTNMKQREVSEVQSGNSEASNVNRRGTRFGAVTPPTPKAINPLKTKRICFI